jgi:hypothetical protein
MVVFLLQLAIAAAGSFEADMDVDTYVDANNASQSYSDGDLLWVATQDGTLVDEAYLSFKNLLGSQGIYNPDQIKSATLTLDVAKVEKTGKIIAYFLQGAVLDTVTWDDKANYDSAVSSSPIEVESEGSIALDVTPLIKKAVETCTDACPYSIVLVAKDSAKVGFTSSEASKENMPILEYITEE